MGTSATCVASPLFRSLLATRDGAEHRQGTRALEVRFYRDGRAGRTREKKNGPDVFRHRGRRQTPYSLTGESESGVLALEASRFFDRFAFAISCRFAYYEYKCIKIV